MGGEEGRQEEGSQEEDREEEEAQEEAPEGQGEANLEARCPLARLARKAWQEQGWSHEGGAHKNKHGKIVSRKASARAGKNKWIAAVVKARKELKLKGFVACKKGTAFYKAARKNYGK